MVTLRGHKNGGFTGISIPLFLNRLAESVNAHYCPNLGFLPICPASPEWAACRCGAKENIENAKRKG